MENGEQAAADPADLGLLDAADGLRGGTLSAVELLDACERRIAKHNGGDPSFDGATSAVNAWVRLYPEVARRRARVADEWLARGGTPPLLCGIPVGVKDVYAVGGLPLTASSHVLASHVAERDSAAWKRLSDVGVVLVGHTHTHEFAAGGTTDQVGNPWSLDRSAGGSSAGSAAALACGMVPAALGTDTCGSLRIPAALCGVSAVKPTHGRVPMGGIVPLAPSLDHAGPMARSLADCGALLTDLVAGGSEPTPLMPPPAMMETLPRRPTPSARPLAGVTVALTDRPETVGMEPDVADGLAHARRACAELGANIVELPAAAELPSADFSAILLSEAATYHARHADAVDRYRTSTREFVEQSRGFTSAEHYLRAQYRRAGVTKAWEDWFVENDVDVILEPTTPTTAPARGAGYDSGNSGGPGDPLIQLTATWDVTGFPVAALSAGLGRRTRLPVGISLIATRGAESRVLRVGIDLQGHTLPPLGTVAPRADAEEDSPS